jgi:hypothetical protein
MSSRKNPVRRFEALFVGRELLLFGFGLGWVVVAWVRVVDLDGPGGAWEDITERGKTRGKKKRELISPRYVLW